MGETIWKLFVFSKEGKTDETYQMSRKNAVPRVGERNRGHTRLGCNARLSVVKQQTGNSWVVSHFVEEHNHGLTTPSRVHLLRSHRKVSATKKALAQQFSEANIPTCQQVRLMEIESGGPSSMGCTEKDIRNHVSLLRQEQMDSDNRMLRCFWADSELRRSYAFFGDVVVFDTTYNTNKYSMVFSPFVGVNHHGQTIIFGCELLSDETIESFVWLFSKFLEAMPNQAALVVIITDQDAAISKAISMLLPFTLHRFCLWHILNKFSEKFNAMLYNEQYHRLVNIIKQSKSPEKFEQRWIEIMKTTNLGSNKWLINMYEIRNSCTEYMVDIRWYPSVAPT
ncbi:protein FAR1-RELATED SEQUENCE 5-like [Diospyros lotus]|uniref:protein FAR1-RELATED SEQUENCE 5-like n=1 Tax=Diospyros lotus TaxID=55363 RepID=UPI00225A4E9F|nr:protein FAR1-RELATED SEQUENCE 5-like [Diospyros lotus]